jgi:hypothetical protein
MFLTSDKSYYIGVTNLRLQRGYKHTNQSMHVLFIYRNGCACACMHHTSITLTEIKKQLCLIFWNDEHVEKIWFRASDKTHGHVKEPP